MALGPKELGSWANDPILSTEIRGGAAGKSGREELLLLRVQGAAEANTDEQDLVPTVFAVPQELR